jgi:hypothetical protein
MRKASSVVGGDTQTMSLGRRLGHVCLLEDRVELVERVRRGKLAMASTNPRSEAVCCQDAARVLGQFGLLRVSSVGLLKLMLVLMLVSSVGLLKLMLVVLFECN